MKNPAENSDQEFQPYITKQESMTEFTVKSILMGIIFGILFGSGLIGGQGFTGVIVALYAYIFGKPRGIGMGWLPPLGEFVALALFAYLGYMLYQRTKTD